jgi:hypothetical protein
MRNALHANTHHATRARHLAGIRQRGVRYSLLDESIQVALPDRVNAHTQP